MSTTVRPLTYDDALAAAEAVAEISAGDRFGVEA
jgi:hypothetical protein